MSKIVIGQKIKLRLLLPHLKKNHKILDLGCGNMWLTNYLKKDGYDCIGFSLTLPADIVGDVKKYKFKKGQFDVVIALEMIEHVDCLKEIDYMLKPGGLLILSSPVPHLDWLSRILEKIGLFQDRETAHVNLFYLHQISSPFKLIYKKILLWIDQFGVYKKVKN